MHRDPRLYLDDMLDAIESIRDYTVGLDFGAFQKDRKTQDAVVRNLEIIRGGRETWSLSRLVACRREKL